MHAGAFGDDLSHLTTHAPNETRGTFPVLVTRIIGEDSMQIAIVNGGPIEVVTFAFAAVVFAQRDLKSLERFDFRARPVSRLDRKSTRLNSSHLVISYAVFCLKKKLVRDTMIMTRCFY